MTIIAGFKCYEGIVLCADTLETVSNLSKRNVPKLRFEPSGIPHKGDSLAVALCGASDTGPFIDKVVETAWEDAQITTSLDEACEEIEKSIKRTYREFGQIYQPGFCPTADLIYGVKMHGACRLFSANGPLVNEKGTYDSAGAGYYMADFLAKRMYGHHLTIHQCVILAAYILFQAKEHVDGCGGDSNIAVLRDDGVSGWVDYRRVNAITELLGYADQSTAELLLTAANMELDSVEFQKDGKEKIEFLDAIRIGQKEQLEQHKPTFSKSLGGRKREKTDFLGLPLPPDEVEPENQ
ncbi:MAG: hypothetical protein LAN37_03095 [Acidobacteriia bacterium]|nr:hypothetical protein [Terriglobia bacterium]